MPFTDTRLGPGTLLLGATPGVEHGQQVSAIALTPATDSTDGTPTLAVPEPAPEIHTTYTLDGTAINDFTDPAGLQRFAYDNDGVEVPFVWTPITEDGTTLTGSVVMSAFPMGGNVSEQLTTDFSWGCVGKPVFAPGSGGTTQSSRRKAEA